MQHWWPCWTFVTAASSSVVSSKINIAFQTEEEEEEEKKIHTPAVWAGSLILLLKVLIRRFCNPEEQN